MNLRRETAARPVGERRLTGDARLVARLTWHQMRSFTRTPLAMIFTVAMPLMMTVIVGAAVGGEEVVPGVRVMQFVVPVMMVFGIAQGCFGILAIRLADLRDRGCLKRLRGTPVPAWAVMAGLAGASLAIAVVTAVLLLGVGLVCYDVQVVWRTLPALLVTVLLGALCFTALGFAVVALVPSPAAVQLLGTGLLLALAFISDIILVGARMPGWLDAVAWLFPLRHFAVAVRDAFNPFLTGAGFHGDHLAVLAAWAVLAAAVAVWRFRWERPHTVPGAAARGTEAPAASAEGRADAPSRGGPGRRPPAWRLVAGQAAHAALRMRRDLATVFFTVALPVLLMVLISLVFGGARMNGVELPLFMLAAMTTYTVGVSCYVNLAEMVTSDRERGVAKRLAGTPLPRWAYYTGYAVCALGVTLVTTVVLALVARFGYGVAVGPSAVPGVLATVLLGVACFTAAGALVASLVRTSQAANAITLGTFLPLAFVSDVFVIGGGLPAVLETVGEVFPLKHLSHALLAAFDPAGRPRPWADLAVIAAWTAGGALAVAAVTGIRRRTP